MGRYEVEVAAILSLWIAVARSNDNGMPRINILSKCYAGSECEIYTYFCFASSINMSVAYTHVLVNHGVESNMATCKWIMSKCSEE